MSIAGDTQPRVPGFNSYSETVLSPRRSGIAWQTATLPGNATLPTVSGVNSISIGNTNTTASGSIAINASSSILNANISSSVILNSNISWSGGGTGNVVINATPSGSTINNVTAINCGSGGSSNSGSVIIGPGAATNSTDAIAIRGTASNANGSVVLNGTGNGASCVAIAGGSIGAGATERAVAIRGTVNNSCSDAVAIGTSSNIVASSGAAVAIGLSASAGGSNAVAIRGTATPAESIAIRGTVNTGATNSIAIGVSSSVAASSTGATAIGDSASAGGSNAVAIRGTATPADSIAIRGTVNTGATMGIAIGNLSTVNTGATNSIAIGYLSNVATNATESLAIGYNAQCSALNTVAIGKGQAGANGALAIGVNGTTATHAGSIAIGYSAVTEFPGQINLNNLRWASGMFNPPIGISIVPMMAETTGATSQEFGTSEGVMPTTNPTGRIICPNYSMYIFDIDIVARATNHSGSAAFNLKFAFDRGINAASSTISPLSKTILYTVGTTTGWDVTATADTTNGRPNISVTGGTGQTVRWIGHAKMTKTQIL